MRIQNPKGYTVHLTVTPPTIDLLAIGTEVTSTMTGRQNGIIIGYNDNDDTMFYHGRRYPYVILWEDGYFEVYSDLSFKVKV